MVPASNPKFFRSFKLCEFIMSILLSKETVKIIFSLCKKSRTGCRNLWAVICAMFEHQINLICICHFINWVKNTNYWNILELIYSVKYTKTRSNGTYEGSISIPPRKDENILRKIEKLKSLKFLCEYPLCLPRKVSYHISLPQRKLGAFLLVVLEGVSISSLFSVQSDFW